MKPHILLTIPIYATAVGLVMHAFRRGEGVTLTLDEESDDTTREGTAEAGGPRTSILSRMKRFFEEF